MRYLALALGLILMGASAAGAMEMRVAGDQIILSGGVNLGDAVRLQNILTANTGRITTVILHNSPGGDANTGFAIGNLIRAQKLRTALAGYCRSACSRMYLGGVERVFTDAEPADKTYVAFHGNYTNDGRLSLDNVWRLREWIIAHSDGKADPALVDRWTTIKNRHGFAYFFDSARLHRSDGVTDNLCDASETRVDGCEKIQGKTGYDLGIFTAATVIKVNP